MGSELYDIEGSQEIEQAALPLVQPIAFSSRTKPDALEGGILKRPTE
jgi:hypothetical protein